MLPLVSVLSAPNISQSSQVVRPLFQVELMCLFQPSRHWISASWDDWLFENLRTPKACTVEENQHKLEEMSE